MARAYLDQMERNDGLSASRIASIRTDLISAERGGCGGRGAALTALASQVRSDVAGAADKGRAELVTRAIGELAKANCTAALIP